MALNINLSLNDFRSILGKVNDGDVVAKRDGSGVEKANYGNAFLNLFRTTRKAENNPTENIQVRATLMNAIRNSAEGKVLSQETMTRIFAALGMHEVPEAEELLQPLSRRQLKAAIDIIDEATRNNALIKKDVASLKSAGLYQENVYMGVADAMNTASCLKRGGTPAAREQRARMIFGNDFKGRSPAEVDRFVRDNLAVIREHVFDKLYWENPELDDFTAKELENEEAMNQAFYGDEEKKVTVDKNAVIKAFRQVVGALMEKYAAGKTPHTHLERLAPQTPDVAFVSEEAKTCWKQLINTKGKLDRLVSEVFAAPKDDIGGEGVKTYGVGTFAALQLDRAVASLQNHFVNKFNAIYSANHFNSQATETAFAAELGATIDVLNEIKADLDAMGPEAAGKVRAKLAKEISRLVLSEKVADNAGLLPEMLMKALDNVVKGFSTRHVVENFVNAHFALAEDKAPIVNFFMEKIGKAGEDGGVTAEQRAELAKFQKAVLVGGDANALRQDLEVSLLSPLANEYEAMVAQADPAKVAEQRKTRNDTVFAKLVAKVDGYAQMNDEKKLDALLKIKVGTLMAALGTTKVAELGIVKPGGLTIKSDFIKSIDPQTGKPVFTRQINPAALKALDDALLELNDKDFDFFSQYEDKGMRESDTNINIFSQSSIRKNMEDTFKNALREGTISISSIPKDAVKILSSFITTYITSIGSVEYKPGIRETMPEHESDGESPLGTCRRLVDRLSEQFAASGIQPVPAIFQKIGDDESVFGVAQRLNNNKGDNFARIHGFGTTDLGKILNLFKEMGLSLAALEGKDVNARVDFYEKLLCLDALAAMRAFKLEGLPEFTERVTGKEFKDVRYVDILKAMQKFKLIAVNGRRVGVPSNIAIQDPLSTLTGDAKTIKELFAGEATLANTKLTPAETNELLSKSRELYNAAQGVKTSVNVTLKGVDVTLTRLESGALSVKVGGMPLRAAFDVTGMTKLLENEIATKPNEFSADVVKSALPRLEDVRSGKVPLVRARELYAKTAAAKTGSLPVMFSAYTTEQLRKVAVDAVDGKFTAANIPSNPPQTYNSGAMIEMHSAFSLTSAKEVNAKVKIRVPEGKSIELRRSVPPDAKTVRNVVADLFLNKDTWEFDASATGKAKPGERIRKLLVEHEPELAFILKGLDGNKGLDHLAALPPEIRDTAKAILKDIGKIDLATLADAGNLSDETKAALAAIEAKIGDAVNSLIDSMQTKVTQLFAPKAGEADAREPWQKTFAELNGKDGIDVNTRQGAFTMKVLQNYFKNSAAVDKRAMLSAFIRNTDADASDAKQVAELLKGAGPLLQKMLQGLPLSSFNAETQLALKDMKSRLLPIPDEAVKAQMLELVRSSNGEIYSIDVKRSLGAASVGQAFLCNIKTKAHPYVGEECVIKLLRPNVDTAIQREKALIDKLIADDPSMKATFDGQYRKILEEFDLTLETTNVNIGTNIYERPGGVANIHTMQMLEGTQPTMTAMVIRKAEGDTFDNTIEKIRADAEDILSPIRQKTVVGGKEKTVYKAANAEDMAVARRKLVSFAAILEDRRNQILDVTKAWFENALFGNGFFHGDLHGGNLMTGVGGTTFIDFGNCSRLSKAEQDVLKMMFATITSGDTDRVISNFKKLLTPEAKAVFDQKFANGSPAMKNLEAILKRGTANDLMPRLQAFISAVQAEDVAIPPALQNFVQSYMRLSDIVDEIDRQVDDLNDTSLSIYCDAPEAEPVENEPALFAGIRKLAKAYVGNADEPCSNDAIYAAADEVANHLANPQVLNDLTAKIRDMNWVSNTLKPFIEQMQKIVRCNSTTIEFDTQTGAPGGSSGANFVHGSILTLEKLQKKGQIPSEDADAEFGQLEYYVTNMARFMAADFVDQSSTVHGGNSAFSGLSLKIDKSMTDVCTDVISSKEDELKDLVISEFGYLKAYSFASRLRGNSDVASKTAGRQKKIGPELARLNKERPLGERLTGKEMMAISRATKNFLVQSPRPDASANWCATAKNRADMLTAIAYNLSRGIAALGGNISDAGVRHAALNFGLSDAKLIESITALGENDYNLLMTDAGAIDAQNGNHHLSTALSQLRSAAPILQNVTPEEDDQ